MISKYNSFKFQCGYFSICKINKKYKIFKHKLYLFHHSSLEISINYRCSMSIVHVSKNEKNIKVEKNILTIISLKYANYLQSK
jgi:hypothetical protein